MAEPVEYLVEDGEIELNAGRPTARLAVRNTGDRPVQVGSHYHFFEANRALDFDRVAAYGMRLDIPAGTAVRFEPGDERTVTLVAYGGERRAVGFSALVDGPLDDLAGALARARALGFLGLPAVPAEGADASPDPAEGADASPDAAERSGAAAGSSAQATDDAPPSVGSITSGGG